MINNAHEDRYADFVSSINDVIHTSNTDKLKAHDVKSSVQENYEYVGNRKLPNAFFNWGLIDHKITEEYQQHAHKVAAFCNHAEINSQYLIYKLIQPLIKMEFYNKDLLDIGCGNGIATKISSVLLNTKTANGLDLALNLVANATDNFHQPGKLSYLQGDAESLPFASNSFDIVTNLESSHLYPNLLDFYQEALRVLKPGGFFCYADIFFPAKQQSLIFEKFLKQTKKYKIILTKDITKDVQRSIYNLLIQKEKSFMEAMRGFLNKDNFYLELRAITQAIGITFLPRTWIRFKDPMLKQIGKEAKHSIYWGKKDKQKHYFCYLIQKLDG